MSKSNVLSSQPYKGTQDLFPEDMLLRRYIYDVWRDVCESFGYEEYQTPLLELAEIYRAKSGDEVGGKELFTLTDLAGRELAIRPEMTPSVTRMVSRRYQQWAKPIRLFNISNFARNERPQRGRNREFTQLNFDIFGENSYLADVEILWMALEIMISFGAPASSFVLKLNSRKLLDEFLNNVLKVQEADKVLITRLLDKYNKLSEVAFEESAAELGLDQDTIAHMHSWMGAMSIEEISSLFPNIKDSEAVSELITIRNAVLALGYSEELVSFSPGLVRGFDYYDGMIFEVFDLHPDNNRSLFGGGRYNGLANLFGSEPFPAVGCAPGDETLSLFLQSWNLIPDFVMESSVFLPLLTEDAQKMIDTAHILRYSGLSVTMGTKQISIGSAMKDADSKKFVWVLLIGDDEIRNNTFSLKNMSSGEQKTLKTVDEVVEVIQSSEQ